MENYQIEKLDEFRVKRVFSPLGFIIVDGIDLNFVWTGKFFKWVLIKQQKVRERYLDFDDGWSYRFFWQQWKTSWKYLKIIKK